MALTTAREIYVNLLTPFPGSFLIDLNGTPGQQTLPNFTARDRFPVRLYFAKQPANATAGEPPVIVTMAPGESVSFTGRLSSNMQAEDLLFSVTDFTPGEDTEGRTYYEGVLNLNTLAINGFFSSQGGNELSYIGEIKPRNSDNTERQAVARWTGSIVRAVYLGTEGVPVDGDPVYPPPGNILTTDRAFTFLPSVSARVGGNETDLDGQPLSGADAGRYFTIDLPAEGLETWKFRAGDEPTNEAGGIVRHADWAEDTFEYVFERRG
jgi:hypothetical protein